MIIIPPKLRSYGISTISDQDSLNISQRMDCVASIIQETLKSAYVREIKPRHTTNPLLPLESDQHRIVNLADEDFFGIKLADYIIVRIVKPAMTPNTFSTIVSSEILTEQFLTKIASATKKQLEAVYPSQATTLPWEILLTDAWSKTTNLRSLSKGREVTIDLNSSAPTSEDITSMSALTILLHDPCMRILLPILVDKPKLFLTPEALETRLGDIGSFISKSFKVTSREEIRKKWVDLHRSLKILCLRGALFTEEKLSQNQHLFAHRFFDAFLTSDPESALQLVYKQLGEIEKHQFTSSITRDWIRKTFTSTYIAYVKALIDAERSSGKSHDYLFNCRPCEIFDKAFPDASSQRNGSARSGNRRL